MESLANVIESHKGEVIEVVTHAGQKLGGIVNEAFEDFFTITAVTQSYLIPYAGVSTIQWPSERPERYAEQRRALAQSGGERPPRSRRPASDRKSDRRHAK